MSKTKEFIVALELGSSKITGIAGRKNGDGSIAVLAIAKEDATSCIRKGIVYNLDRTTQCIRNIISKLRSNLKSEIAYVYVGVSGQSMISVKNVVDKDLPRETIVSQSMIDELIETNRLKTYTDSDILDAITQEYKVDAQRQMDPVGVQCTHLEGNFLNVLWRSTYHRNLNKCLEHVGVELADDPVIAPLALADAVLTDSEKRSGCLLVDIGAQTTSVMVYYKNVLRHLVVLPLGSHNITKDISSLQIDETEAEQIKLRYANAYTEEEEIDDNLKYPIEDGRQIEAVKLIDIVEARVEEIIANVIVQIPDDLETKLLGGVILTGGGSQMKNIDLAFRKRTSFQKVRIANFVSLNISTNNAEINHHDGTLNTALALLDKGQRNCAGMEVGSTLFATTQDDGTAPSEAQLMSQVLDSVHGRSVETKVQEEKKKETAQEESTVKEESAKRKSWLKNKVKGFFNSFMQEEE